MKQRIENIAWLVTIICLLVIASAFLFRNVPHQVVGICCIAQAIALGIILAVDCD